MFGQRASSQTVCSDAPWMSALTSKKRSLRDGARTFIHSGRRGRSATGCEVCIAASVVTAPPDAAPLRSGLVDEPRGPLDFFEQVCVGGLPPLDPSPLVRRQALVPRAGGAQPVEVG